MLFSLGRETPLIKWSFLESKFKVEVSISENVIICCDKKEIIEAKCTWEIYWRMKSKYSSNKYKK